MAKIQKFKIIIFIAILFAFNLSAKNTFAARLYFESQEPQVAVMGAKNFSVVVNIDAGNPINAIQATVSVPEELTPVDIVDGNSIINFWVEKPKFDESSRLLTFSGIIPGGFQGEKGSLLVVKFKTTKREGKTHLSFDKNKTKVYLHTSEGVKDLLELGSLTLPIAEGKENIGVEAFDRDPPEDFKPEISHNPNIFENRLFLVFATQDKGSGIDHYKVCEGKRKCVVAENPYLLENQGLKEEIVVKAADKAGNERIVKIAPRIPLAWYENFENWVIIIMGIIIVIFVAKKIWRKKRV